MATRVDTCPTCHAETATTVCDNCGSDIPQGTDPAVSGRVWDPATQAFRAVVLCDTCADLPISLRSIVTPE